MKKTCSLVIGLVAVLSSSNVDAIDGVSLELGTGESTDMGRIGAQWEWDKKWAVGEKLNIGGYWDVSLGYWRGDSSAGDNERLVDGGFTPVFRLQENSISHLSPYVEAGVGAHLLSEKRIHARKNLGSHFEFGVHIGLGFRFGDRGVYDLGYRLQHLSNAGLSDTNPGINFHQLRFAYHF